MSLENHPGVIPKVVPSENPLRFDKSDSLISEFELSDRSVTKMFLVWSDLGLYLLFDRWIYSVKFPFSGEIKIAMYQIFSGVGLGYNGLPDDAMNLVHQSKHQKFWHFPPSFNANLLQH